MTNKFIKFFIASILSISMIFCSVTAFAVPNVENGIIGEEETTKKQDNENNKETEENGMQDLEVEEITTEKDTEKPTEEETEKPTKAPIEKPEEEKTTEKEEATEDNKKPSKPRPEPTTNKKPSRPSKNEKPNRHETEKPHKPSNNKKPNRHEDRPDTTRETETTTKEPESETLPPLPEGSFYVFLELNNGSKRLKRVMDKPGLVPEPNEPKREGYIFDGWYSDKKFKKPFNFYTDYAKKEMTIYAKWAADKSTIEYSIKIGKNPSGGKIEVNPSVATEGEPILITVVPNEGKRLKSGSLKINGKSSDVLGFLMPGENVVITAEFENIPVVDTEEEKSVAPFIIIAVVILLVIIISIILIIKKKNEIDDIEVDENGTIIDDDDDDSWIDKTIVVESGFKNGKKRIGKTEPIYDDDDNDDFDE